MKNDNDINNSLSNIKKALREAPNPSKSNKENEDYFLLENVIEKKALHKKAGKSSPNKFEAENNKKNTNNRLLKKSKVTEKNKIKNEKIKFSKKLISKKKPVEIVINNEIKPIIQKWITKNLRGFVKKVVVEEFKVISKAAFKQNSSSK